MKGLMIALLFILGCSCILAQQRTLTQEPQCKKFYQQCTANCECPIGYCCVIGKPKFSIPYCSKMGGEGEPCTLRANIERDRTIWYPGGHLIKLINGYATDCPCMSGLVCLRGICSNLKNLNRP